MILQCGQERDESEISRQLSEWKYSIASVSPGNLDAAAGSRGVLLVVFGSSRPDAGKLRCMLQSSHGLSCIGIFHSGLHSQDHQLAELCEEVISWPCEHAEFSLRLSRVLSSRQSRTGSLPDLPNMLGKSVGFMKMSQQIDIFTQCSAPVLIEGETGTGKEMVARAIHYKSARAARPFIPVNCGALPDSLVENELFGHAKGAYTDAKSEQAGLVAQANSGTLFLDEIEALSPKAQVTLLRFLQEQTYRPLGSSHTLQADVRLIAACNESTPRLVESGKLRQDLFFRLNILHITLPPLRERSEDIPLLAQHFINRYCRQYQLQPKSMCADLVEYLRAQSWPGNIRELENAMHRLVLLVKSDEINLAQTGFDAGLAPDDASVEREGLCFSRAKSRVIENFEREYLKKLMRDVQGNVTLAAKRARKERRAFGKLLKKHNIQRVNFIE
jgi:DNA-binding NtrC family response regulator